MRKSHRDQTVGPWAKQKLDALESYLVAYQQVMLNQPFKTVFVDAFAGAGNYEVRSSVQADEDTEFLIDEEDIEIQKEYISGSPVRALGLKIKFDHYRFIDADPDRAKLLSDLETEYPNIEMKVRVGDANANVQHIARNFGDRKLRGVAFLDPYGAHLHWQTVASLAATKKFDVIINCPIHMAIDRLVKRDGDIPSNWSDQLDAFFGCRDWFEVSYDRRNDLFGASRLIKHDDASKRQLDLYVQRLRTVFKNVSKPSLVCGTRGQPLYYLIWAGENGRGLNIAEHILGLGSSVKVPRRKKT